MVGTGSTIGIVNEFTEDSFRAMADLFNEWGEDAVRNGFDGFFFHNHDREFAIVNGRPLFDILLEETDPRYVKFEVDLGWVSVAGEDPYEYLRRHQSRFPMFHIKDIRWDPNGPRVAAAGTANAGRRFGFADLGKGDVDWVRTLSALKDLRAHRYFIEHDDAGNLSLNPAGAPNTVWRGAKHLSQLTTRPGRR
ncbi:sugar phosphate isomerase/epimerase family protein [Micromonospora sp. NPDC006431]|uniref:sugar phosphate isomerase/epimerase family protein n=1 Tax=Micromonospora sp. NPDC006431 TaxID=3364235 RepID=UPI00369BE837